jgi:hypothetical protein
MDARVSLNTCVCIKLMQAIAQACSPDDVVLAIRDLATPDQETPSFALWIISGELAKHVGYLPHMDPGMPRPSCDAACAGRVHERKSRLLLHEELQAAAGPTWVGAMSVVAWECMVEHMSRCALLQCCGSAGLSGCNSSTRSSYACVDSSC